MKDTEISKWESLYYRTLTYIGEIKRFFKRFTKKGREELAYEKMRLDQIYDMILHSEKNE